MEDQDREGRVSFVMNHLSLIIFLLSSLQELVRGWIGVVVMVVQLEWLVDFTLQFLQDYLLFWRKFFALLELPLIGACINYSS